MTDDEEKQRTVDVEHHVGSFAHGHGRVAGHTRKVTAAVGVCRSDGQVAPGRHPLSVREHFLFREAAKKREGAE